MSNPGSFRWCQFFHPRSPPRILDRDEDFSLSKSPHFSHQKFLKKIQVPINSRYWHIYWYTPIYMSMRHIYWYTPIYMSMWSNCENCDHTVKEHSPYLGFSCQNSEQTWVSKPGLEQPLLFEDPRSLELSFWGKLARFSTMISREECPFSTESRTLSPSYSAAMPQNGIKRLPK